jgi:3-hydroxyisobutyrate dehydrogenase-like beta-hydroxyacid dehydrogenase
MRVAVIGLGRMGRALTERLLEGDHDVSVWNRSPAELPVCAQRSARLMATPDDLGADTDVIFLSLADDASVLSVAAPGGERRESWSQAWVANTSTVSPQTLQSLGSVYGQRVVATHIIGAPAAVRDGSATFVVAGPRAARNALSEIWELFALPIEAGDELGRATVIKLLNNQMLLVGLGAMAEAVALGRAAGIDDETLIGVLPRFPAMAPALANRVSVLFDPEHRGWFTPSGAAKDLGHALALAGNAVSVPVTSAALSAYVQLMEEGWDTHDIAAVVELTHRHTGA